SLLRNNVINGSGHHISSRCLSNLQCLEVRLPAFDLRALLVAEIVREQAALSLDHEVEPLGTILLHQNCPVRVIRPERCRYLEPAGKLAVARSRLLFLSTVRKCGF